MATVVTFTCTWELAAPKSRSCRFDGPLIGGPSQLLARWHSYCGLAHTVAHVYVAWIGVLAKTPQQGSRHLHHPPLCLAIRDVDDGSYVVLLYHPGLDLGTGRHACHPGGTDSNPSRTRPWMNACGVWMEDPALNRCAVSCSQVQLGSSCRLPVTCVMYVVYICE
jgi:hypothetical protein